MGGAAAGACGEGGWRGGEGREFGDCVACHRNNNRDVVCLFAPGGEPVRVVLQEPALDLQFSGSSLWALNYDKMFPVETGADRSAGTHAPRMGVQEPFMAAALPDGRIAVFRPIGGYYHTADLRSEELSPARPLPDPHFVRPAEEEKHHTGLFLHVAASPEGKLYCELAGYRVQDGSVISEFDANGQFLRSLRFTLPRFERLLRRRPGTYVWKPDHFGYLIPYEIAFSSQYLYLVDYGTRKAAYYELP